MLHNVDDNSDMSCSDSDDSGTRNPEGSVVEFKSNRTFCRTVVQQRSIAGTALHQSRVILDSGTEATVAGGCGWRPLSISDE